MIKIKLVETSGFIAAFRGMRNPMNSWDHSDNLGPKDHELASKLVKAGSDHAKFRRMMTITCDIIAPMYWWKEFDTYKVGTVSNSTSTMHTIHKKEFTLDDFSFEYFDESDPEERNYFPGFSSKDMLTNWIIPALNSHRKLFLDTGEKKYWYQMIQLLPSSYNYTRTVLMNYEVLANIYRSRKDHRLDEWREFCKFFKDLLPFSELFTLEFEEDDKNDSRATGDCVLRICRCNPEYTCDCGCDDENSNQREGDE